MSRTKTELLEEIKKNLTNKRVKESITSFEDILNDNSFDADIGEVVNDRVPIYEQMSVDEQIQAKTWPPTTLPARNLVPYLKRMKGDLRLLVIDDVSGANMRYLLDNVPNIIEVVYESQETNSDLWRKNLPESYSNGGKLSKLVDEESSTFDFVFIANPFYTKETLEKYYANVNTNGYFGGVNYNHDDTIAVIKQFRRENKIGVNINITESGAWFWRKEDYTVRNIVNPVQQSTVKASDSHLKLEYLDKYGVGKIFVETGTYLGQTVELVQAKDYTEIHSIELNEEMADKAKEKFKTDDRVKIWQGDSSDLLKKIVDHLEEPATFWLDAHASGPIRGGKAGGSPVIDELNIILSGKRKDHTIFIDDKRLFGSAEWSFVKLEDAMKVLEKINPSYKLFLLDGEIPGDIICATVK